MFLNLIRWFRGYVVFQIIGKFPERFLNLSIRQGRFVLFSYPCKEGFTAALLLCDYRTIRPVARKASVRLKVKERHGLPFLLRRYRARWGLLAGMVLFLVITVLMQSFVWTVECNGLTTIGKSSFESQLREEGVYAGAFKPLLDLSAAERNIMKNNEKVGWMSVNIIGTKAEVEVKEKELKPHILEADVACNVKAGMDGLILSMETKYGKAVVSPGSAVIKGSLLVSSIVENPSGDVSIVHADARVMAKTQREQTFVADKNGVSAIPAREVKRYWMSVFWFEFPVSFALTKGDTASFFETESIFLNNTQMPVTFVTEHCTQFKRDNYSLSSEQAENLLITSDYLYRLFSLSECESINAQRSFDEDDSKHKLSILYECVEDIAVSENLVVN